MTNKKLTTNKFIQRANDIHDNKYDYSKSVYVNYGDNIIITCIKHGDFIKRVSKHLTGQGCQECSNKLRYTTNNFIKRAQQIHNFKYTYELVKIINANTKIIITCPIHGIFKQLPVGHINGKGCIRCANTVVSNTKEFIKKSNKIHNNKYNYYKSKYVNCGTKLIITCKTHGDFLQTPNSHLCGKGCIICSGTNSKTIKEFIISAQLVHGSIYDYSKSAYNGSHSNVLIICKTHGKFYQAATTHLSGSGCQLCAKYGYKTTKLGTLYILRYANVNLSEDTFIKIGITNNFSQRFKRLKQRVKGIYTIQKIHTVSGDGLKIKNLESKILEKFKTSQYTNLLETKIDGKTEFFKETSLMDILTYIKII